MVQDGDICLSEYLQDLMSELLISLVDVAFCEDIERGSHQGKQCGVEVDSPIRTEWHVHGDQTLNTNSQNAVENTFQ